MKSTCYALICYTFLVVSQYSCNQAPKHPQAILTDESVGAPMNEKAILYFTDSIEQKLPELDLQSSLIYSNGDGVLHVDRYSQYGKTVLFVEHSEEENLSALRKYFLKNDSLIFVYMLENKLTANGEILSEERDYLRNNTSFKREYRSAKKAGELEKVAYKNMGTEQQNGTVINYGDRLQRLADAAAGRNQFNMVFDQFINHPGGEYILLKSREQNGYTSKILVKRRDDLVDSLASMPELFRNENLNLKWKVKDSEAVYTEGSTTITSARGLNK